MELVLSPAGRRYGAKRDTPDPRDLGVPRHLLRAPAPMPPNYDISSWAGPVKDQGSEGSCTAHGGTSLREYIFKKYYKFEKTKTPKDVVLSPSFTYYMERQEEGTLSQGDCGAEVRSSVLTMNKYGSTLISVDPYNPGDFSTAPTAAQLTAALAYLAGAYHRITTVNDAKSCILSGYPFVIGFTVYDSFEGDQIAKDGLMPMPDVSKEGVQGGHEVFGGLAYDDDIQCPGAKNPGAVLCQNSWSTGWGLNGRFWMPYDFLADSDLTSDIWMQHLGKAW